MLLSIQVFLVQKAGNNATRWGWKTSTSEWNDVAVYAESTDPNIANWQKLEYPSAYPYYGRKTSLAFTLSRADQNYGLSIQEQTDGFAPVSFGFLEIISGAKN